MNEEGQEPDGGDRGKTDRAGSRMYLAFDLETVKPFPDGEDWRPHRPLGIGCAAAAAREWDSPIHWCSVTPEGEIADQMSREDLQLMVRQLTAAAARGYTITTWNGLGFDFDVLGEESGLVEECRSLALSHVDMMFQVHCKMGHPVALAQAAKGMETTGKTEGMDGKLATEMWALGDREPVVLYCEQDVEATLELALACEEQGKLVWIARSGRPSTLQLHVGWMTVGQAMNLPEPDTSWMDTPIPRESFTAWLGPEAMPTRPVFRYPASRRR